VQRIRERVKAEEKNFTTKTARHKEDKRSHAEPWRTRRRERQERRNLTTKTPRREEREEVYPQMTLMHAD